MHVTQLSCVSSQSSSSCRVSSRAVRQARHSQNAWDWAWHIERVKSCRVETWRAKWNLGYIQHHQKYYDKDGWSHGVPSRAVPVLR